MCYVSRYGEDGGLQLGNKAEGRTLLSNEGIATNDKWTNGLFVYLQGRSFSHDVHGGRDFKNQTGKDM